MHAHVLQALPDERNNMVVVQCWDHTVPGDEHLKLIVDAILAHCKDLNPVTDLRPLCKKINTAVREAAAHH